jgi:hypothetical protein
MNHGQRRFEMEEAIYEAGCRIHHAHERRFFMLSVRILRLARK